MFRRPPRPIPLGTYQESLFGGCWCPGVGVWAPYGYMNPMMGLRTEGPDLHCFREGGLLVDTEEPDNVPSIWVVVRFMVPSWVPQILGAV